VLHVLCIYSTVQYITLHYITSHTYTSVIICIYCTYICVCMCLYIYMYTYTVTSISMSKFHHWTEEFHHSATPHFSWPSWPRLDGKVLAQNMVVASACCLLRTWFSMEVSHRRTIWFSMGYRKWDFQNTPRWWYRKFSDLDKPIYLVLLRSPSELNMINSPWCPSAMACGIPHRQTQVENMAHS